VGASALPVRVAPSRVNQALPKIVIRWGGLGEGSWEGAFKFPGIAYIRSGNPKGIHHAYAGKHNKDHFLSGSALAACFPFLFRIRFTERQASNFK